VEFPALPARLATAGQEFPYKIYDNPNGRCSYVADAEGNLLGLADREPPERDSSAPGVGALETGMPDFGAPCVAPTVLSTGHSRIEIPGVVPECGQSTRESDRSEPPCRGSWPNNGQRF
jgi:hypothetical protein